MELSSRGGWIHTSSSAIGDSGTVGVRAEQEVVKDVSLGAEYEYHGAMNHYGSHKGGFSQGDVSGHSIVAEILYYPEWAKWQKLQPYVFGGPGWSWWNWAESDEVKALGITVDAGDNWCYKVGAGLEYPVSDRWSLQVEWSFFKAYIPKDARHADGSFSAIGGDDNGHVGEEELSLVAGAKYKF